MSSKNTIEGILLNKIPFKEKNIIGHILLRNGHKLSVVFYGGQGGGKRHIGSTLQVGYLISFSVTGNHKQNFEMLGSTEYREKWYHSSITDNIRAFYLMCFFNETLDKFSPLATTPHDMDEKNSEQEGLFRLLSNAIFRLNKISSSENYKTSRELGVFLTKAMVELGVFPNTRNCEVSGESLKENDAVYLSAEKGGFVHFHFLEPEEKRLVDKEESKFSGLHRRLEAISKTKYSDITDQSFSMTECHELLKFICYQQHLSPTDFKTFSALI